MICYCYTSGFTDYSSEKHAFLKEGEVLFFIELKEISIGKEGDSFMPIIKDIQL
jgi:hypothetical protein